MTAALDALAEALAAFQAEVPVIPKKQTASIKTERGRDYSYSYADLADISPVVMPLLAKHGLAFLALPKAGNPPLLVGMLVHTSGQRVRGELPITGRTPQEIGSSLTYGRRYLLGCLTGVVTDEDEDGALSERAARSARRTAPGPPVAEEVPVAPPTPIRRRNTPRSGDAAPGASPHGPPQAEAASGSQDTPAVTEGMRRALFGAIGKTLGPEAQRAERLALCAAVVGREITSSTDLDAREVSRVLAWLEDRDAGRVDWSYDPYAERGHVFVLDPEEPPQ